MFALIYADINPLSHEHEAACRNLATAGPDLPCTAVCFTRSAITSRYLVSLRNHRRHEWWAALQHPYWLQGVLSSAARAVLTISWICNILACCSSPAERSMGLSRGATVAVMVG